MPSSVVRLIGSRRWAVFLAAAVAYAVTARVGLALALPPDRKASPVSPAAGVALTAVLLFGRRAVPGVWAGAFVGNAVDALSPGTPHGLLDHLGVSAGIATGSAAQSLAGVWLVRRWADGRRAFDRVIGVFGFAAAVPVAGMTAATIGTGTLWAGGFAPAAAVPAVWLTWWLGDAIGILLVAPLAFAWTRRPRGPRRPAEAAALVGLLAAVGYGVFGDGFGADGVADPLAYLTVPFLVWAAVRFGRRGAAVALAGVAAAAAGGTAAGVGPFVRPDPRESLLLLDVFLLVAAGTGLVLAAVLAEREGAEAALAEAEGRLRQANARLEGEVADRTAALRASEERFRAFTDNSPAVCFMKDEGGRFAYLSKTFQERFGVREADWLGKTDADLWPAELAEQFITNDRAVLASDRPVELVERVADPDGTVHSWRTFKFAFGDGSGRRYVGGTAIDITDHLRAEAALRQSEEEFRRLFENSPIGIYRTTPDGRILMANPAAVRLAGGDTFEEVAARNLETDGPHSGYDRAEFRRRLEADGQITGLEARWPGRGGRGLVIRENARVVRGPDGGVQFYEGTMEDVTDRRRAEETLRVLFDRSSDAHLLFDEAWGIFDANPAAAAMLGFADKGELIGRHPAEFSPPAQPDGRLSMEKCVEMDGLARRNGSHRFDWQHVRADGTEFPCEVTLTPVEIGGRSALLTVWHDLTDRKRAEDALRASEERFRRAFDSSGIGMALAAADGRLLQVNPALCGILGYAPDELVGTTFQALTHPDDLAANLDLKADALAGRRDSYQLEKRYRHKDGHTVWAELTVAVMPAPGADGAVLVGQVQDITARREAEAALRASRERFELAVRGSRDGIWDWDLTTEQVYFSARWKEMLGYAEGEIEDRVEGWAGLVHPDDLPRATAALTAYFDRTAPAYGLEVRMLHKDGSWRWVYTRGEAVRDGAGRPLRMAGSHTDVTDRKAAEEENRRLRGQLSDAIEGLDAGVVMYGPDRRLVVCNSFHRRLYQEQAHCLTPGTPYEDILRSYYRAGGRVDPPGVDEDTWVAGRMAVQLTPGPPREWLHEGRWLLITDRRTRDGGVVSLRADITPLKRAQEAAEAASRAKSEFLANMSHEIRTPMNGILGMTDLVLDTPLAPDQRDFLRLVRESGTNLLRIINDVLDFSKVEAGRMELEAAPFRLRDAVCRTVEPLAVRAAQKGLGLEVRVAAGVPDRLVGDAGRVGQVLVNLVGNAIKFTDAGGVTVAVGCGPAGAGGEVELRVSVADTGIGIPAGQRASVFDAFVQADASLTRKYGGTGLGLAISARLVGLMGGRIWVDSEEGAGSTFHFTARLPLAPGAAAGDSRDGLVWVAAGDGETRPPDRPPAPGSADAPAPAAPPARRLRVLVAEDQPVNQKLVERMLANRGHACVLVGDGRAALDRLAVERFDAVLMDVQMPVLDGLAATAALRDRERGTGRRTPVIALTAHALTGDRDRCLAAGCDEYLSKPVTKAELYPLLEAVADRAGGDPTPPPGGDTPPPAPAFDRAAALGRVNGDAAFLAELVEMFLDRWPAQRADLAAAVAGGNAVAAQRLAHTLKGTLAALGGVAAVGAAAAIDKAARDGGLAAAGGLVAALEREVGRFADAAGAVAAS